MDESRETGSRVIHWAILMPKHHATATARKR
jgi:hypothetical protein